MSSYTQDLLSFIAKMFSLNYGLHNRPRLDMMITFIFSPLFALASFYKMNYYWWMVIYSNYWSLLTWDVANSLTNEEFYLELIHDGTEDGKEFLRKSINLFNNICVRNSLWTQKYFVAVDKLKCWKLRLIIVFVFMFDEVSITRSTSALFLFTSHSILSHCHLML